MEYLTVFITATDEDEAVKIARAIVEDRLAGCVNIIKDIRSIYRWEGKTEDAREVLLIAKTRKNLFNSLAKKIKEIHSYTVPEIIALPILDGSESYLQWLAEATG